MCGHEQGTEMLKPQPPAEQGVWASSVRRRRELGCNLVLCKILVYAVVWMGPASKQVFGTEFGGRNLLETTVLVPSVARLP